MTGAAARAQGSQSDGDRTPVHCSWEDYRRTIKWQLPGADSWGLRHGVYAPIVSSELRGHVVRIPAGHGAPLHRAPMDLIIVQLAGEPDFSIGNDLLEVTPYDMLVVPASVPQALFNAGFEDALFFAVHDRPAAGETCSITYRIDEAEEGWDAPSDLQVIHSKWDDYRRQIIYRGGLSEIYGYDRGVYPILETATIRGHPVRVPAGQGSPWRTVSGDAIFVGLRGEIEVYGNSFTARAYSVGPLDLLMMPPPVWGLQNPGLTDAVYFSVMAKSNAAHTPVYFEPAVAGNPLAGPGAEVSP